MSLADVRAEVSTRVSDLRLNLDLIKDLESPDPLTPDANSVLILRGLYFVHLYSLIEYTINHAVVESLRYIKTLGPPYQVLVEEFLSLALDADFSSLAAGSGKKWDKRLALIHKQRSLDSCAVNEAVLGQDLQNIWCETMRLVFKCFAIGGPVFPDPSYEPFFDEIVNKRNAVAHGRETAARMGRGTRSPDLLVRFNAVSSTCNYVLDRFDVYLRNLEFVRISERPAFRARLGVLAPP